MFRALGGAALLPASVSLAFACGVERWPVKVAADQNSVLIAEMARPATIPELSALAAPNDPASRPGSRFRPAELTLYEVSGTLLTIAAEPDGDYRLVIADIYQPQMTMVARAPDPACAAGSRYRDNIIAVRDTLDQKFGDHPRLAPNLPVTVTGIAFFSRRRGADGAAPNGVALHPLIGIAFP